MSYLFHETMGAPSSKVRPWLWHDIARLLWKIITLRGAMGEVGEHHLGDQRQSVLDRPSPPKPPPAVRHSGADGFHPCESR